MLGEGRQSGGRLQEEKQPEPESQSEQPMPSPRDSISWGPSNSSGPMSAQLESELNRLAEEGASALTKQPALAAAKFEQAHELALGLGQAETAASLSTLIARSWNLRSSLAQCIRFSRRAVREAPDTSGPHYTLGHFCEKAAARALRLGKKRRATLCFLAARNAFNSAADFSVEPTQRASMKAAAEDCSNHAQRLLGGLPES